MKTRLSVNDAKNFEEMKLKKNKNYFKDIISDKDIDYNTQKIPLDEIIKKGLFHYIGEFDTNVLLSISSIERIHRGSLVIVDIFSHQYIFYRDENDFNICPKCAMVDIPNIQLKFFCP